MTPKFGTSGLRGLSTELVGSVTARYVTAFAHMLLRNGHAQKGDAVLIGQDFRPSSPEIAATAIGALKRAGFEPLDCGQVPTPALALYGLKRHAGAIMITGSHIPADRNGLKFYRPDGEIEKPDEVLLAALAEELEEDESANRIEHAKAADMSETVWQLFLARYQHILPANAFKDLKIGIYQHSSVARDFLVQLINHYGGESVPLGFSESFIPVDTEAVSAETRARLVTWTKDYALDAIISTDGDADRPLVSDEHGEPLRGDLLGLIAADFLNAKIIATPVTSNSGIERASTALVERTRVGSPFVIAAMKQAIKAGKTSVLGFEANGGTMLASDFTVHDTTLSALPTRDCVLPILTALYGSAKSRLPLSRFAASFNLGIALSDRLENFATEKSAALMAHLRESGENLQAFVRPLGTVQSVSDIDGLRITLADGSVVHFRPSGNAPEMRCYCEAESLEKAEALLAHGLALLDAYDQP